MPINLKNFTDIALNSRMAGANRIIVENEKVKSKGMWQRFKMSFMRKKQRKALNADTVAAFLDALTREFGDLTKLNNTGLVNNLKKKQDNGTQLLVRDVRRYTKSLQEISVKTKPDLELGDPSDEDPVKAEEYINKNYGVARDNESFYNYLASVIRQPDNITDSEAVSLWCVVRGIAVNNEKLSLGKQQEDRKPMMRQALSCFDKLPDRNGWKVEELQNRNDMGIYTVGSVYFFPKFRACTGRGEYNDEAHLRGERDKTIFYYKIRGSAGKDVSSITGGRDQVMIRPDAKYTCTGVYKDKNNGRILTFDVS